MDLREHIVVEDLKTCTLCGAEKPLSNFVPSKRNKSGYRAHCRSCHAAASKKWREENPELYKRIQIRHRDNNRESIRIAARRHSLKMRYGITEEQYQEMLEQQAEVCAICEQECPSGKRLAVDHDEKTGCVRGLLCMNCNQGIGKLKHSSLLLERARVYLDGEL